MTRVAHNESLPIFPESEFLKYPNSDSSHCGFIGRETYYNGPYHRMKTEFRVNLVFVGQPTCFPVFMPRMWTLLSMSRVLQIFQIYLAGQWCKSICMATKAYHRQHQQFNSKLSSSMDHDLLLLLLLEAAPIKLLLLSPPSQEDLFIQTTTLRKMIPFLCIPIPFPCAVVVSVSGA